MEWRLIPSLSALRAFEAAARTGSLSAAARELNVTHAAIAQHLRHLSEHFGTPLMERQGQGMALTEDGGVLAAALSEGFGRIESGIRDLADRHSDRPIALSLTPSFAEAWLMPRIGDFWARHPEIELTLSPSATLVDLRRESFDLAIRFGDGDWPGLAVERLHQSPFAVVGAPKLLKGRSLEELGDLAQYTWYFSSGSREQIVWGGSIGLDFSKMRTIDFPNNGLAISALRSGYGLSIQAVTLVRSELETGALESIYEGDPGPLGYFIVTREGVRSDRLKTLVRWLHRMAAGEEPA